MKVSTGPGVEVEFEYTFELKDPCNPPVSVSVGVLEDQGDYTPTQTDFPNYTHAEFNVDPAYCPLTYSYSYEKLNNGDTAITKTATEREFSFRYDSEVDSGDTETVTVTATSSSLYTTTSTE